MIGMGAILASSFVNLPPPRQAEPTPVFAAVNAGSNVVPVDFQRRRSAVRPTENSVAALASNEWQKVAIARLGAVGKLQAGWDGLGSVAISKTDIAFANRLIDVLFEDVPHPAVPSAVGVADGSLQLEWRLPDVRIEVAIEGGGIAEAWVLDRNSGLEETQDGPEAISLLLHWARRLTADKLAPLS